MSDRQLSRRCRTGRRIDEAPETFGTKPGTLKFPNVETDLLVLKSRNSDGTDARNDRLPETLLVQRNNSDKEVGGLTLSQRTGWRRSQRTPYVILTLFVVMNTLPTYIFTSVLIEEPDHTFKEQEKLVRRN